VKFSLESPYKKSLYSQSLFLLHLYKESDQVLKNYTYFANQLVSTGLSLVKMSVLIKRKTSNNIPL